MHKERFAAAELMGNVLSMLFTCWCCWRKYRYRPSIYSVCQKQDYSFYYSATLC